MSNHHGGNMAAMAKTPEQEQEPTPEPTPAPAPAPDPEPAENDQAAAELKRREAIGRD